MTDLQKKTIKAIVNIFETGKPLGDYGRVTVIKGDRGQLTYGRSQTTLASGNLGLLLRRYCGSRGAQFGPALEPYLPRFDAKDVSLNTDMALRGILQAAGQDPVMRAVQDQFFDDAYWVPATLQAANVKVTTALGAAVVYDSVIHGSWARIRDRVGANAVAEGMAEETWVSRYVDERRKWLLSGAAPLPSTVYRMDSFKALIDDGRWTLRLPVTVRGFSITASLLEGGEPVEASAEDKTERLLLLTDPPLEGPDVRRLQKALGIAATGRFDAATKKAVEAFQSSKGLRPDGKVGPLTRTAIGM